MKIGKLAELEKQVMEEVVRRRKLGGYSMEAEGMLLFGEALLKVIGHIIEEYPQPEE
jgi:hypothetical protein